MTYAAQRKREQMRANCVDILCVSLTACLVVALLSLMTFVHIENQRHDYQQSVADYQSSRYR